MAIKGIVRTIACWESISNYVGAHDTYRYTPSQAYRSHNRLLWPLPQPYCSLQYLSIDSEAERLCPAIGIDPHNCRPFVGPIAYSVGYDPGYEKELSGTQAGRSNHNTLELRIEHTQILITTLLLRPSTSSLGHNKDRQRRGFFAGLKGVRRG